MKAKPVNRSTDPAKQRLNDIYFRPISGGQQGLIRHRQAEDCRKDDSGAPDQERHHAGAAAYSHRPVDALHYRPPARPE
ncbi:hypothetical protein SAMN05216210_2821 [Halopseudomonas salegens]|uniref:Uncharacterized protein n=1 Tax=Halopseudomonas salegens TaxID=1434072 RepID=A0A1H2H750_9GAMM|nr:hypothetical protein SAMN05216210_2821 [Halopseudomonas salegens]